MTGTNTHICGVRRTHSGVTGKLKTIRSLTKVEPSSFVTYPVPEGGPFLDGVCLPFLFVLQSRVGREGPTRTKKESRETTGERGPGIGRLLHTGLRVTGYLVRPSHVGHIRDRVSTSEQTPRRVPERTSGKQGPQTPTRTLKCTVRHKIRNTFLLGD